MRAINYYIVVENIKTPNKKVAGLFITDDLDTDNRYVKAKVIAVGNLVEGLQDNDIVFYDKHAGNGISWKEKLYHVIKVSDVVLVE
jgi:co-chaperonin GroES (HSP10)